MYVLHIEHTIADYDGWKKSFDSDPVGRVRSGVRRYKILRPVDDQNYVLVDLEFDTQNQAEGLLAALRGVWAGLEGTIMSNPKVRISKAEEIKEL